MTYARKQDANSVES